MGRPLFEAVPDDVEITKLTIGQRDALARYKRHENINTFLGNETTPKLIFGLGLLISTPFLLKIILEAIAKQNGKLATEIGEAGINWGVFSKDLTEAVIEVATPGGGGILFEGEAQDFWDKYVKK